MPTVPNEETPIKKAENIKDDQQDSQPTPNFDTQKSPKNIYENQVTTLLEYVVEIQKEKIPTNTHGEKYKLRTNPAFISQIHTKIRKQKTTKTELAASQLELLLYQVNKRPYRQKKSFVIKSKGSLMSSKQIGFNGR